MSNAQQLLIALCRGESVPLGVFKDAFEEEGLELPWYWTDEHYEVLHNQTELHHRDSEQFHSPVPWCYWKSLDRSDRWYVMNTGDLRSPYFPTKAEARVWCEQRLLDLVTEGRVRL